MVGCHDFPRPRFNSQLTAALILPPTSNDSTSRVESTLGLSNPQPSALSSGLLKTKDLENLFSHLNNLMQNKSTQFFTSRTSERFESLRTTSSGRHFPNKCTLPVSLAQLLSAYMHTLWVMPHHIISLWMSVATFENGRWNWRRSVDSYSRRRSETFAESKYKKKRNSLSNVEIRKELGKWEQSNVYLRYQISNLYSAFILIHCASFDDRLRLKVNILVRIMSVVVYHYGANSGKCFDSTNAKRW